MKLIIFTAQYLYFWTNKYIDLSKSDWCYGSRFCLTYRTLTTTFWLTMRFAEYLLILTICVQDIQFLIHEILDMIFVKTINYVFIPPTWGLMFPLWLPCSYRHARNLDDAKWKTVEIINSIHYSNAATMIKMLLVPLSFIFPGLSSHYLLHATCN